MDVGSSIKELRLARGLTQEELADTLYVSRQTISHWESGVRQNGLTGFCPAMIH